MLQTDAQEPFPGRRVGGEGGHWSSSPSAAFLVWFILPCVYTRTYILSSWFGLYYICCFRSVFISAFGFYMLTSFILLKKQTTGTMIYSFRKSIFPSLGVS